MSDSRRRSLALLESARARFEAAWNRAQRRRPPRRPGEASEPAPVEAPRSPTLSGGAAATID